MLCIQAVLLLVAATGVLFLLFMPKFVSILSDERLSINDFHRRYRMRSKSGELNKSTEITNTGDRNTTWQGPTQPAPRPTGHPVSLANETGDRSDDDERTTSGGATADGKVSHGFNNGERLSRPLHVV